MDKFELFLILALGVIGYFVPALISGRRKHPQANSIFALNLLLGWTILGWIGALVWSLTAVRRESSD